VIAQEKKNSLYLAFTRPVTRPLDGAIENKIKRDEHITGSAMAINSRRAEKKG
jgi:hypothetical protein